MPRREAKSDGSFKKWVTASFVSNYHEVQLDPKKNRVYQYSLELEPEVPDDSSEVFYKVIRAIRGKLKEKIGFLTHKGKMLWGSLPSSVAITIPAKFEFNGKEH